METSGAVIGLFIFLAVLAWSGARASERKAQARYALLAKAAEQNTEGARLVLEFLREDEAKKKIDKSERSRRDTIMAGSVITVVGIGAAVFLHFAFPGEHERIWPVGLFLVLFGGVGVVIGYFNTPKTK